MKSTLLTLAACCAAALIFLIPVSRPVYAGAPTPQVHADQPDLGPAAAYCVSTGGEVETRTPYFNTNDDPKNWLRLSGSKQFCQYTLKKDGSRIHVLLSTLYAEKPSLAALAYYAKVQLGQCNGNPASCYCTLLGGSDSFGGINLNGGGWVLKGSTDEVLEACIFPDMSSIDSWGLAYHSADIIRGKNLQKVLRFPDPYQARTKK